MDFTFLTQKLQTSYLSSRSNACILKKYHLPLLKYSARKHLVYVPISSGTRRLADRLFRRSAREIFPSSDKYIIPLGTTYKQAVISLCGLLNSFVYSQDRWYQLLSLYQEKQTLDNALLLAKYLKGAAVRKILELRDPDFCGLNDPLLLTETLQSVTDNHICHFYFKYTA